MLFGPMLASHALALIFTTFAAFLPFLRTSDQFDYDLKSD